jgi:hypothetical protein
VKLKSLSMTIILFATQLGNNMIKIKRGFGLEVKVAVSVPQNSNFGYVLK